MAESTYNQRYADGDDNTAGAFAFDTITAVDYAVSKIAFGDADSVTRVTSSAGLPVAQQGTWTVQPGNTANTTAWLVTGTGGTFPVTDSGGSLTVDAPVATPVFVRLSDGSAAIATLPVSLASVPSHAVTNAGTFVVQVNGDALTLLDSSNISLASIASNTNTIGTLLSGTLTVGVTSSSLPSGAATSARQDTGNTHLSTISTQLTGNGSTSILKLVDAAAGGTDTVIAIAAVRDDALSTLTPAEGDYCQLRVDANGALWVGVSGTVAATQSGTWNVTNISGTVSLPTGASTAANQSTIIGHLDGVETLLGTIDTDTGAIATSAASIDGKITACNTGAVVLAAGTAGIGKLTANSGVDIGDVDVTSLPGAAHDAAISGNPVRVGARAETALSGITLVADGDTTDLYAGVDGVLITRPHSGLEDCVSGVASNTDGSSTEVIATAGAGVKIYLTSAHIFNTSATDIYVELKSATTVRWRFVVPTLGGVTFNWPTPLAPNAANEAWNFDPSAAATTVYCQLAGFRSKI